MDRHDWKPIKKGRTYCSPACGTGCLYEGYREAQRDARRLAAATGWTSDVYESPGSGWQAVVRGPGGLTLRHVKANNMYYITGEAVLMGKQDFYGTPQDAIKAAVRQLEHRTDEMQGLIMDIIRDSNEDCT